MGAISEAQMRVLKRFMDDSNFTCTDEWLFACVNWIQEENNNVPFSFDFYKKELREQWQDANLVDMESSCLPPNLAKQRVVKLPGKYGLQMNSIKNIGESSYSQWMKLKKLENENVTVAATDSNEYTQSWQPKSKRCLHLTMTDGIQQVTGIEKEHVPALSLQMKPGIKIIIVGPVACRRGVFHLRPKNVRVIGGEVEELFQSNSVESVLASRLNIDNTLAPRSTQSQQTQPSTNTTVRRDTTRSQPTLSVNASSSSTSTRDEEVIGEFPDSEGAFPDMGDFGDDDDILMQIDEDEVIRSAGKSSKPSTSSKSFQTSSVTPNVNNATSIAMTGPSSSRDRSTFNKTTQRIGEGKSISAVHSHAEEIEDYEDDPDFITSHAVTSAPLPSKLPSVGRNNTSTSKNTGSIKTKSNTNTTTTNTSKSKSVLGSAAITSGAKAALKSTSGTTGSGKQLNIMQYMKPMPVVIDPPTPLRQAVKRRKTSMEEDAERNIKIEREPESAAGTAVSEPSVAYVNKVEDDDDFPSSPSDEVLMKIVDERLESKLVEFNDQVSTTSVSKSASGSNSSSASISSVPKRYPVQVSDQPYIFLKQVQETFDELVERRKVVHVKACVSTVVSNIRVEDGSWNLSVCINDGTGFIDCGISADILNRIIGFTPDEMKRIKAAKTKEGKQRIAEGMNNLAKKLVHLNAIYSVEIGVQPMIIDISDLLLHHSVAIKDKLNDLGL